MANNETHTVVIGADTEYFNSAEEAADRGYELSKLNPQSRICRYRNGTLVSAYSPKMGWW